MKKNQKQKFSLAATFRAMIAQGAKIGTAFFVPSGTASPASAHVSAKQVFKRASMIATRNDAKRDGFWVELAQSLAQAEGENKVPFAIVSGIPANVPKSTVGRPSLVAAAATGNKKNKKNSKPAKAKASKAKPAKKAAKPAKPAKKAKAKKGDEVIDTSIRL